MLNRAALAFAALALMGQAGPITESPPLVKGTALPPDNLEALPSRAATQPPPKLAAILDAEARAALPEGVSCRLVTDTGTVLVAGVDRKALAKPDGRTVPMLYEGPELRDGGYFTAGDITIVVEPDSAAAQPGTGGETTWTTAAIVDRAGRNARHSGTWSCRN